MARQKQVKKWFKEAKNNNFAEIEYSYYSQVESGHNRIKKRQIYMDNEYLVKILNVPNYKSEESLQ